jgi:hypothetical protein
MSFERLSFTHFKIKSTKGPGLGCMEPDTTSSRNDIIANLYRDTERDNTIMTEQYEYIPLYWLCEKLLRLKMQGFQSFFIIGGTS